MKLITQGTAANFNVGTAANNVVQLDGSAKLPAVDGSQLTNLPSSGITLGTPVATTSGTSIDFTGIPATAKKITFCFVGVSTNGTSNLLLQLGDAGGIEATGYLGATGENSTATNNTTGIILPTANAAAVLHGSITLSMENSSSNTWVSEGVVGRSDGGNAYYPGFSKSTSAALDRVRLTTVNGTDAFDAGEVNIQYQ